MTTPITVPSTVTAVAVNANDVGDSNMIDATLQQHEQPPQLPNSMSNHSHSAQYILLEDLVKLVSVPPSKESLLKLSSNVITTCIQSIASSSSSTSSSASVHQQQRDSTMSTTPPSSELDLNQNLMIAYLRAAAHQLHILVVPVDSVHQQAAVTTSSTGGDVSGTMELDSTSASVRNVDIHIDDCTRTILSVICACIEQLSNISSSSGDRLSIISGTGILEALWLMVEYYDTTAVTVFACEFLQSCIICHQYSLAIRRIAQTWPVPKKTHNNVHNRARTICNAEVVLRYYYLRGVVYMGCTSTPTTTAPNVLAIRCFWTCLSIPTASGVNSVSSIAIAAFKKLVLLQALSPFGILHTVMIRIKNDGRNKVAEENLSANDNSSTSVIMPSTSTGMSSGVPATTSPSATNPLSTPSEMPWDLVRFIAQANPPIPVSSSSSHAVATTPHRLNRTGSNDEKSISSRNRYTYPHFGVHVYQVLLQTFIMIDRKKFDTILNEHFELFQTDGNLGYVTRLSNALYYRQIYVISRSYASIPMYQLCTEMNSLSIDEMRVLLTKLQETLLWPVQIITSEQEEVVVFPSDLPRPVMLATDNDDVLEPQHQLMELSQRMQQVNAMIETSSKYKTAMAYYDRQQQQQKSTKNERATSGISSMVMDDTFSNY